LFDVCWANWFGAETSYFAGPNEKIRLPKVPTHPDKNQETSEQDGAKNAYWRESSNPKKTCVLMLHYKIKKKASKEECERTRSKQH
jgi:hypothetical protein